tara:strand:- start:699 stop:893 length:195 start_codon:yes stop_codon:yes gene_type:complete
MSSWEKDVAELKTDIKYLREDIAIMQKQIRDLNVSANTGMGFFKGILIIGSILAAIYTWLRIVD